MGMAIFDLKIFIFFPNGDEVSVHFSDGDKISGHFSHRGQPVGPIYPGEDLGFHQVRDTGVCVWRGDK